MLLSTLQRQPHTTKYYLAQMSLALKLKNPAIHLYTWESLNFFKFPKCALLFHISKLFFMLFWQNCLSYLIIKIKKLRQKWWRICNGYNIMEFFITLGLCYNYLKFLKLLLLVGNLASEVKISSKINCLCFSYLENTCLVIIRFQIKFVIII